MVISPTFDFDSEPARCQRMWTLLAACVAATLIGVYVLSGSEPAYLTGLRVWHKQLIYLGIGVGTSLLISVVPLRGLLKAVPLAYGVNLVLLVVLLHYGVTKGGSATRWLDIGPIRFQPSEPIKILTILMLSRLFSNPDIQSYPLSTLCKGMLLAGLPAILVAGQPDLGTALVFPAIFVGTLYASHLGRRYLVLVLSPLWALLLVRGEWLLGIAWLCGVLLWLLGIVWNGETSRKLVLFVLLQVIVASATYWGVRPLWDDVLKPYQKERLTGFIKAEQVPLREAGPATYHLQQSLIAISSGGLLGQGHGQGLQSSHGFVPAMRTDFIFVLIAEENGFVGGLLVMLLLLFILLKSVKTAAFAQTWPQTVMVSGIVAMWLMHIFVNLGMTMGLSPITGIPLPFVSYGGTSLLSNYLAAGLVLGCTQSRN